jgi:hypothetical protein
MIFLTVDCFHLIPCQEALLHPTKYKVQRYNRIYMFVLS